MASIPTTLDQTTVDSIFSTTITIFENSTPPFTKDITMEADEYEAFRRKESDKMAIVLLPAIIITGINMLIGCLGNATVFYIYLTKFNPSSTRSAILFLASFDLVASCLSMPGEIVDLRYSYSFQDAAFCKSIRFCTMVVLISSGFTLLVVAVDRYRRICHPMNTQLTAWRTKQWALVCLVGGVVFSTPAPVMYGLSQVQTHVPGLYGMECSIAQKYHDHILPLVYNLVLVFVFLSVFTTLIVLYVLLGRQVLQQNKFRHSVRRALSTEDNDHSITDGTPVSPVPDVVPSPSFDNKDEQEAERKLSFPTRKLSFFNPTNRKPSKGDVRTRKTTLMLFIITAVFIISFLPHLILKGIQATVKDFPSKASDGDIVLYNIFVRSYFFNSVANCFIYGFCSPKFRNECKKLFKKLFFCCRNKAGEISNQRNGR